MRISCEVLEIYLAMDGTTRFLLVLGKQIVISTETSEESFILH